MKGSIAAWVANLAHHSDFVDRGHAHIFQEGLRILPVRLYGAGVLQQDVMTAGLRERLGMIMVWITHDMGVVAGIADTVQVMYAGRIMERGPVEAVFASPRSAYTWGLLQSLPHGARPPGGRLMQIPGQPPDMFHLPPGDPFAPRNRFATERCFIEAPPLRDVADSAPGHMVAAWYDLPALLDAAP